MENSDNQENETRLKTKGLNFEDEVEYREKLRITGILLDIPAYEDSDARNKTNDCVASIFLFKSNVLDSDLDGGIRACSD